MGISVAKFNGIQSQSWLFKFKENALELMKRRMNKMKNDFI